MPIFTAPPALRQIGLAGLAAVLMLGLALPAQAQWKWKDAAGNIQYSDLPPPNSTPDKDILQRPKGQKLQVVAMPAAGTVNTVNAPPPPASAASAPSKAEMEQQAKQKKLEQELQAKQKVEEQRVAQLKRENCGRAQDSLRSLESGARVTRPNELGENIPLDDSQRAAEAQRIRGLIGSECR